ncbi:WbqC family protein [Streptomyces noursei]|uniref:WbqC family protein n=1 Tax=Streptomyces noursei TaxID=1971 RepID=UPI0039B0D72A
MSTKEAQLADPDRSRRRIAHMLSQNCGRSRYWPVLRSELGAVTGKFAATDKTAVVAEASARLLLELLGWKGQILRSSEFNVRADRSLRLADIALATNATGYLCGTGGTKYLRTEPFTTRRVVVIAFHTPVDGIWQGAREISALRPLMVHGPDAVAAEMRRWAEHPQAMRSGAMLTVLLGQQVLTLMPTAPQGPSHRPARLGSRWRRGAYR